MRFRSRHARSLLRVWGGRQKSIEHAGFGGQELARCSLSFCSGTFPHTPETSRRVQLKPGPPSRRRAAFPSSCAALSAPDCVPPGRRVHCFRSRSNPSPGHPHLPPSWAGESRRCRLPRSSRRLGGLSAGNR